MPPVGGALPLCRDEVSVFCSPSWLGHPGHSFGRDLPLYWDAVGRYSAAQYDWVIQGTHWRVLPLCRDAVGRYFATQAGLGHPGHSLEESYPSAEMQSVDIQQPKRIGSYPFGMESFCYKKCPDAWKNGSQWMRV